MTGTNTVNAYKKLCARIIQITEKDLQKWEGKLSPGCSGEQLIRCTKEIKRIRAFKESELYGVITAFIIDP